jgi:NADH:ubiquinone oxidoreductase subunit B-like Fe-S oxidoreductase
MRLLFISVILLFIAGCMETPELSPSKEVIAQDQIKTNLTEAEKAKEEYIKLQKQRSSE